MFWVYILQSQTSGRYYIGYTSNLQNRLSKHNRGLTPTTRRLKGPWEIVYTETFKTKSEAIKREKQLKRWKDKNRIERLINSRNILGA